MVVGDPEAGGRMVVADIPVVALWPLGSQRAALAVPSAAWTRSAASSGLRRLCASVSAKGWDPSDVTGSEMVGNVSLFSLSPKLPLKLRTGSGCLECLLHTRHHAGGTYPFQFVSGHCKKDIVGDEKGVRKGLTLCLSFLKCQSI